MYPDTFAYYCFAAIVEYDKLFKFIPGIGGKGATFDQEQGAFDFGELGQATDLGDVGAGFTGAGGHLQQRTWPRLL
jgi:hypothetical protein